MRYVDGTDLASCSPQRARSSRARAVGLLGQVAEALDAAHAHGLVHRDVKPANILITTESGDEHCYLSDFGLARGSSDGGSAAPVQLSGTVDYSAPEQIAREPLDGRADQYGLACVLYECLAGEPPFARARPTATLFAHATEPPPSLHERRPDLPRDRRRHRHRPRQGADGTVRVLPGPHRRGRARRSASASAGSAADAVARGRRRDRCDRGARSRRRWPSAVGTLGAGPRGAIRTIDTDSVLRIDQTN